MKNMRAQVNMDQKTACGIPREGVQRAVFETLALSEMPFEGKTVRVGVATVSSAEMRKLNRSYRKKDAPTDVLSFPEYESMDAAGAETGETVTLGDIILSCDVVKAQAEEDGVSVERELAYLVSHGVLHLLGFEHGDKMFGIQDAVCDILEEVNSKQ